MRSNKRSYTLTSPARTFVAGILLLLSYTITYAQKIPVLDWAVGTTSASDWFSVHSMTTDPSGNTILAVYFSGSVDLDPGVGVFTATTTAGTEYDFAVVKIDATGNLLWAKEFGGTGDDDALALDIDASGNVYVVGSFGATVDFDPGPGTSNVTTTGSDDGFLLKLDANGNFVWVKLITGASVQEIQAIKIIPSGGIAIAGRFIDATDFDPGAGTTSFTSLSSSFDVFVERLDSDGNFVWVSRLGGTSSESVSAIGVDDALNVYTTGEYRANCDFDPGVAVFNLSNPFPGSSEIFASKLDLNGNFVWARQITKSSATPGVAYRPQDLHLDVNNNVILSGDFIGTVDFDPSAATYNIYSASKDTYISKLDTDGNFMWAGSFVGSGSIGENNGFSMDTDGDGNIFIAGAFKNQVDFNPGALTYYIVASTLSQVYITKLAPDGSFIWARAIGGGPGAISGQNAYVNITSTGAIQISGKYQGTRDFDPTPCREYNLTTALNDPSLFLARLSEVDVHAITSFAPTSGPVGTAVTITGTNFRTTPSENEVEFYNTRPATVSASTTTTIDTSVPSLATTGRISVTINCVTVQTATNFTVTTGTLPTITSFTPTSGAVGTTVTITGTNFSATPANNAVGFNGATATVTSSTTTSITTTVPAGASTGKITVTVAGNTATSATDFTVTTPSLPTITSFTPASGPIGTTVTITGTNFSTTPANNTVRFNGTTATATASTTTSITTSVPAGATTGKITVTVAGNTATSATDFTVTAATGIVINPQPQSISTCDGSIETFSIDASGAANITYQWQKFNGASFVNISNGGGYSGVTTKILTINTNGNFGAGDYRCRVSGNATPDVMSQTASLEINPYPLAEISINGSLLVASPGDSYQWYQNGNEVSQANEQTFALNVAEFGSYVVAVTANGCTTTSEEFIYLMTGAETIHNGLKIYPNPFKENIAIELPSEEIFNLTMVDALGRVIRKYSISHNETLDLGDLNNGVYILILQRGATKFYYRVQKVK